MYSIKTSVVEIFHCRVCPGKHSKYTAFSSLSHSLNSSQVVHVYAQLGGLKHVSKTHTQQSKKSWHVHDDTELHGLSFPSLNRHMTPGT